MKNFKMLMLTLVLFVTLFLVACTSGTTDLPTPAPSETTDELSDEITSESEPESTPESTPASGEATESNASNTPIDLNDIANYWIEIDGIRYAPMEPYSKFIANFENAQIEAGIGDITLKPNQVITVSFMKSGGGYLFTSVINLSNEDKLVKDCTVRKLSMDDHDAKKFDLSFISGIKIGSTTRQEIETLFGEASEVSETSSLLFLRYFPKGITGGACYVFRFDQETKILNKIEMEYIDWPN